MPMGVIFQDLAGLLIQSTKTKQCFRLRLNTSKLVFIMKITLAVGMV